MRDVETTKFKNGKKILSFSGNKLRPTSSREKPQNGMYYFIAHIFIRVHTLHNCFRLSFVAFRKIVKIVKIH